MSPNWLSAIGQATPAIRQTMQDIQERPKEEARWGFEQEKMGMQREQFGQTKAVNEMTINKMKYEEKQRQEKEAYLNKPWNAKMDLMLADLPEDYQEKALKMMRQTGLIDENNVGKMKSREMVTEMFKSKPEIFEWYAKGKEVKLKGIAEKAMEDYQKLNDDPGTLDEKKAKARDKAIAAGEQLSVFMGGKSDILSKMKTAKEYEGLLNDIKKSDTWKTLSPEEKGALELGAIEAVKTGSIKGWEEAVKNVVKKEKATTEKSANIHYETDDKGNTIKIVSDPITGETIRRENMGKIGKGKSTVDEEKEKRQIGKDVAGLRKEFDALKEVKDYKDVRSKMQVMEKALTQSKTSESKVAVDQALITLFNKMTDPQSVVRESEYIRTPENMSLYSAIVGKIEKIRKGGASLTDVERNALIDMAREFYKTYEGLYDQSAENYRGYATKSGLDPDMVIKIRGEDKIKDNIILSEKEARSQLEGKGIKGKDQDYWIGEYKKAGKVK